MIHAQKFTVFRLLKIELIVPTFVQSQSCRYRYPCQIGPVADFARRFLLRRAAVRAISASPSKAYLAQPRSINTLTPSAFGLRQQQSSIASFQRRFASDEASKTDQSAEAAAADASENFAQTAAEAPVEENLTPAQQEVQSSPTNEAETVGPDALEAAVERAESSTPQFTRRAPKTTEPNKVLYIGNLYYEVTADQLKRVFSRFGEIEDVKLVYDNRGLSRGYVVALKNHRL